MAEVEAEETEVSYTEEDLEAGSGGGSGPGDDIRVAVKGFQQDADKFSYDIEVKAAASVVRSTPCPKLVPSTDPLCSHRTYMYMSP